MKASKAKSLADYRALHDPNVIVPNKIRKALADILAEGKENWEYEADFMKRAALSQTQIGQFREQFAEHVVETPSTNSRSPRRVWFGSIKVAAELRGE